MAWTYSGNPGSSAKDYTRFLLGDTDICDQQLQDGEITFILGMYNNAAMNAAIRLADIIAAKYSRQADESVGRVSQNYSQKARAYRQLRKDLVNRLASEDAAPFCGGISYTSINAVAANEDRVRPKFEDDMMQNRQVGPAPDDCWYGGWAGLSFW